MDANNLKLTERGCIRQFHTKLFLRLNPENGIYADKQMSLYKKRYTDCIAALG